MDIEQQLRASLADQAADAPRASESFFDDAVRARRLRRRHHAAIAGVGVGVVAVTAAVLIGTGRLTSPAPVTDTPTPAAVPSAGPQEVQIIGEYRWSDPYGMGIIVPATTDGSPPQPEMAWVDSGASLAVTSYGSSSCPSRPTSIEVTADALVIDMAPALPDDGVCTPDLAPYTVTMAVPDGVDPTVTTPVLLDGRAMDLPPAAAEAASPIEVRVVMPGAAIAAGQSVDVIVSIRNITDTEVTVSTGCTGQPIAHLGLTSPTIPFTAPPIAAVGCEQTPPALIPPGGELQTSATLRASYQSCTQSPTGVDSLIPLCIPGAPFSPPLPPGAYAIDVFIGDLPSAVRAVSPERIEVTP